MDVKRRVLLGHDPKRFPLVLPSPDSPTSEDLGPRPAAGLDSSDDEPGVADEDDEDDGDDDIMARNAEEDRKRLDDDSYRSSPSPSPGFGVGAGAKQGWRRAGSEVDDDSPVSRGGGLGVGALALPLRGESKTDDTGRRWRGRDDFDDYDDDEDDTTVEHGGRLRRHDVSRNNSEDFGAAAAVEVGARRGPLHAYSRDGTSPESVGSEAPRSSSRYSCPIPSPTFRILGSLLSSSMCAM
jgi:hypothetical protein